MVAGRPLPRKFGISAPSGRPANVSMTASLPSLLTIVNVLPTTGVCEPLNTSVAPLRSTVPATFNWEYCVSTVVPSISIAKPAPAANETLPTVISVPAVSGWTVVPGSSTSDPPAVSSEPGLNVIPSPLTKFTAVLAGREMAALTVIAPLAASPMVSVPAVIRSSSASVRPSVSGLPDSTSSLPKSINVPAVSGRSTTSFAPASTDVSESRSIESPVRVRVGVPRVSLICPPASSRMPKLDAPLPDVPITSMSPPLDVIRELLPAPSTPWLLFPVPAGFPPTPRTVTVAWSPVPSLVMAPADHKPTPKFELLLPAPPPVPSTNTAPPLELTWESEKTYTP